jgi:hypothetical protein
VHAVETKDSEDSWCAINELWYWKVCSPAPVTTMGFC